MTIVLLILTILMMIFMPIGAAFLMFLVSGGSWMLAIIVFTIMAILEIAGFIRDGEPMFD